ncbi:MAG: hypothetical protein RMI30_06090 [Thermodesulfovibrio sp.]|nr:hypothetical protein [Thermodesulfovibrio sp.]
MKKYLYYAAYGSNMCKERFLFYINGGEFRGKQYIGCNEKTPPEDGGWLEIPYRLYFAKKSSTWDSKGVAFLSCNKEPNPIYHSIVRLWKISEDQFEDIQKQEGSRWYNVILHLGNKGGLDIKTFTGCWEKEKQNPSASYIDYIKKGLRETTQWSDDKINEYLSKFL